MSRGAIIVIAVILAVFAVVFLTSGDQPVENTPDTRFEVSTKNGTKEVPAERQIPPTTPPAPAP